MSNEPVFIHSGFRTASTWLWAKIRALPTTVAYCEYFHETLGVIERSKVPCCNSSAWASKHPKTAPYFLEFLPLISDGGGVKLYEDSMAFDRYIPAGGLNSALSDKETSYVQSLIDNASQQGKLAVLTECRTLCRSHALKAAFGGKTIFLHRNLFHQWASYSKLGVNGAPYFLETIDKISKACRHDPVMAGFSASC